MATRTMRRQLDAARITVVSVRWITVPAGRHEIVRNAPVIFVHEHAPRLSRLHKKARSPVLAPAPFVLLGTLRPLLSIAQDGYAARVNALRDEVIHCSLGSPLPKIHVELVLAAPCTLTVTLPLDQYELVWVRAQPCRVHLKNLHVACPDCGRAEIKIDVPQRRDPFVVPHPRKADALLRSRLGNHRGCLRQD